MKCCICDKEIARGKKFQGTRYQNYNFCSEACYEKFIKLKSAPKPKANYKPQKGSPRRKFTDYIQEWTNDMVNWQWIMKQAKDIQEEYELDWPEMYYVLKYCREYEMLEWDLEWGLYQFFPKYIEPTQEFIDTINQAKALAKEDLEDEYEVVKKNVGKRVWRERS